MPKTRRTQMLLRAAIQADYLRNKDPQPRVETSGRLPPPPSEAPQSGASNPDPR